MHRRMEKLEGLRTFTQTKPWRFCDPRDRGGRNECLGDACPLGEKRHEVRCIRVSCTGANVEDSVDEDNALTS
jgi:hypothetical protein